MMNGNLLELKDSNSDLLFTKVVITQIRIDTP